MDISIVVPVYGSPGALPSLVDGIEKVMQTALITNFEIILVNDGCPKGSWQEIINLQKNHSSIIGINFSRNFGQHYAILAGLKQSSGDRIVVMDCDMQDDPAEIPRLFNKAQEGYDLVYACRTIRQDSLFKKLGSKFFYAFLSYMTNTKQDSRVANFGIYDRKVIDALLRFEEKLRFFPVNVRWLGFDHSNITVGHNRREDGKTSYSFKRLFALAFDVVFGFSDKPMYLLVKSGLVISILSLIITCYFAVQWLTGSIEVEGWAGIMVSIWFMFGITILSLGMVGLYVAKAFDEAKKRPLYVVDEIIGEKGSSSLKAKS